ncbi:MAG TPA: TlpA disulfide reductase family protein, partial [Candidatus Methylacidiphilales bacterium]
MKFPARLLPVALLCAFLPLSACSKPSKGDGAAADAKKEDALQLPPASARPPAPAWTLKTPDGKTLSLADYKGKIVALNFWATWCPPCRAELPELGATAKTYAP